MVKANDKWHGDEESEKEHNAEMAEKCTVVAISYGCEAVAIRAKCQCNGCIAQSTLAAATGLAFGILVRYFKGERDILDKFLDHLDQFPTPGG